MATVAAVYAVAPFVRSGEELLQSLMPRQPVAKTKEGQDGQDPGGAASPGGETGVGEPRTGAGGGDRRGDAGSGAPRPRARQALGRARRRGRDAARPRGGGRRRVRRGRHGGPRHREGSPELAHWAWTRVRDILEGKARRVAASMRRAATVAGLSRDTRKPVDTCADYLLKYAPYLHYDRYLAAGYPIATGVIEGACRHLVRDRMELTGARWRLVGAEAVLKLRALRASGDFDAYWDFHEACEYERNHAQRYADAFVGSSSSYRAARRTPWTLSGTADEKEPHSPRFAPLVSAPGSSLRVANQRRPVKLHEVVDLKRRHDARQVVPKHLFQFPVADVAGRYQEQLVRASMQKERIDEVFVLGDQHAPFANGQIVYRHVRDAVALGQVPCVQGLVSLCDQPAGHAARKLRVDQELHETTARTCLTRLRRAANAKAARMSSGSRSS